MAVVVFHQLGDGHLVLAALAVVFAEYHGGFLLQHRHGGIGAVADAVFLQTGGGAVVPIILGIVLHLIFGQHVHFKPQTLEFLFDDDVAGGVFQSQLLDVLLGGLAVDLGFEQLGQRACLLLINGVLGGIILIEQVLAGRQLFIFAVGGDGVGIVAGAEGQHKGYGQQGAQDPFQFHDRFSSDYFLSLLIIQYFFDFVYLCFKGG